jgi:hypothetical protein
MVYEFRWTCEQVVGVVAIQVSATDEAEAGSLAALLLHDLSIPSRRRFTWRPGAVTVREGAK